MVEENDSVCAWGHFGGDLGEMKVHRFAVAGRQDQGCSLALLRADGPEDVGRGGALVARRAGACAALGPTPRDLVFLADTRLIFEPDLYPVRIDRLFARDFVQTGREVFLNASIAPAAWAWWRGRAVSCVQETHGSCPHPKVNSNRRKFQPRVMLFNSLLLLNRFFNSTNA